MHYFIYCILLLSCLTTVQAAKTSSTSVALHLDWLNPQIDPKQNFYQYANGGWLKTHPLPHDYARWGAFQVLQEKNQHIIHHILEAIANTPNKKPGSNEQKIGDFYFSGMDEVAINAAGITPLHSEFDRITNIKTLSDLQPVISHLQILGVDALFNFGQMQDYLNSKKVIGVALQGGLGLPDRDYYLRKESKFIKIRAQYQQHIAKMFTLLGNSKKQATAAAKTVMDIETKLANASMSRIEQRDPYAIYHPMSIKQLDSLTPHFSWPHYFAQMQHPEINSINLAMPNFFKTMDNLLITTPIEAWKTYLRWHVIHTFSEFLPAPYVNEDFNITAKLTGVKKLLPRWKRVVNAEDQALGFAIGQFYIKENFSIADKQHAQVILIHIQHAMKNELQQLSWMTALTKQAAIKKLNKMNARIGYPNVWRDYSQLDIDKGPYIRNVIRANVFLHKRELNKIGKPVDKNEWDMTPQTVNAYYDPSKNELTIPAGILQDPFFNSHAPASVNYGAIGLVMGHEITHGFDDQGAQFDEEGNLKNWWTSEDLKKFNLATQCIANQFSKFTVAGDLHVQGKLVMGEATADLGGGILAYRAFQLAKENKQATTIKTFPPDQQVFLGAAHMYATNINPDEARRLVITDPHPPAVYRVNGTFANIFEFTQAFQVIAPSLMINQPRCIIW